MNTINDHQDKLPERVQHKAAKFAGLLFIFNLLIPTLGYIFIQSRLFDKTSNLTTSVNVIDNMGVFSIGIISELVLAIGLVTLGYFLYLLVRRVNQNLALFAFIIKVIEATLMAVVSLISFIAFQMIINSNSFDAFSPQQIKSIAGFLLNQHESLNSIPMIFLGIEMVIFSFLFVKSRLIPVWISYFGIISFSLIFIYGIFSVTTLATNIMGLTLPSFVFELICGSWLLFKGIAPKKPNNF